MGPRRIELNYFRILNEYKRGSTYRSMQVRHTDSYGDVGRPQLSSDVLTIKDADALAISIREAILVGKGIHPVDIERLCCFVIKADLPNKLEKLLRIVEEAKKTLCTAGNAKLHAALTDLERYERDRNESNTSSSI